MFCHLISPFKREIITKDTNEITHITKHIESTYLIPPALVKTDQCLMAMEKYKKQI